MEDSGGSKVLSVIALALGLVALVVAVTFGTSKPAPPPAKAVPDGRVAELDAQVVGLKARLAKLEGAPKAAPAEADKAKYVTLDAALRDQELLVAELQAKVKRLEAEAKAAPVAPAAAPAAAPAKPAAVSDEKVLRTQRIEIVDAAGKVRGVIEVGANGAPAISFLDQDGKVRGEYSLTPSGNARLIFSERDGKRYSLLPIVTETVK